jgi:hypothetical protein
MVMFIWGGRDWWMDEGGINVGWLFWGLAGGIGWECLMIY